MRACACVRVCVRVCRCAGRWDASDETRADSPSRDVLETEHRGAARSKGLEPWLFALCRKAFAF